MAVNYIDINDTVAAPQGPWSAPNSKLFIFFCKRCCVSSPCWLSRPRIGSARRWIQKDSDVVQSNELFVCGTHLILWFLWKTPKANTINHTNSSRAKAPFHLLSHEAKRSVSTAEVMGVSPDQKCVKQWGNIWPFVRSTGWDLRHLNHLADLTWRAGSCSWRASALDWRCEAALFSGVFRPFTFCTHSVGTLKIFEVSFLDVKVWLA
jgi:hypothetical protein